MSDSETKPKPKVQNLMDYSDDDDGFGSSSDEDAVVAKPSKKKASVSSKSSGKSKSKKSSKKKKKKKKSVSSKGSGFMEDEAEESEDGEGGSSDESDEEDNNNDYVADGFVVNSEEEEQEESSDDDSSSDEDSDGGKKLTRLRRKRDDLSDMEEELDELKENEVKKAKHDDEKSQNEEDDEDGYYSANSMDNFIVDEEDEDGNQKKKKKRRKKKKFGTDEVTDEQAEEYHKLFSYKPSFFEGEDDQEGEEEFVPSRDEKRRQQRKDAEAAMHGRYEPDMLKGEYLTALDLKIKQTDVPERIQLQQVSKVGENRYVAGEVETVVDPRDEEAMALQARWVVVNLEKEVKHKNDLGIAGEAFDLNRSNPFDDRNALAGHVQKALEMFQRYQLEVPYVHMYAAEDVGMLSEYYLWAIYDLGLKYRDFVTRVKSVRNFVEKYISDDITDDTGLGPLYFEFTQYASIASEGEEKSNETKTVDDPVVEGEESKEVSQDSNIEEKKDDAAAGGDALEAKENGAESAGDAANKESVQEGQPVANTGTESSVPSNNETKKKVSTKAKIMALLDVFMTTELCDEKVVQDLLEFLRIKYRVEMKQIDDAEEAFREDMQGDDNDENNRTSKGRKLKRASIKKSGGTKVKIPPNNDIAKAVGDSTHLGANVEHQRRVYNEKSDPADSPQVLALELLSEELDTEEKVLKAVQNALSQEIALEYRIRGLLRDLVRQSGKLSTKPTIKGRKEVADDPSHQAYPYISLENKPFASFLHPPQRDYQTGEMGKDYRDQILYILRAQRNGLLTVSINAQEMKDRLLSLLLPLYLSPAYQGFTVSDDPGMLPPWDRLRYDTLLRCTESYLVPWCQRELVNELRATAVQFVTAECDRTLRERIEIAPFSLPVTGEESVLEVPPEKIHAMGLVLTADRKENGYVVALDASGTVLDHREVPAMQGRVWQDVLDRFIEEAAPHVVAVSSSVGMRVRQAKAHLEKLSQARMAEWNATRSSNHYYDDESEHDTCPYFYTAVLDDQVANAFAASTVAEKELPGMEPNLRKAISIARYMQNPLAETSQLFSDISNGLVSASESNLLAVHFHRSQRLVPASKLLSQLERAFIDVTSMTGVDINKVVRNDHVSSVLQFVPGFGPRKASALLQGMKRAGTWMYSREDVRKQLAHVSGADPDSEEMECLFRNCAGFIQCKARMEEEYDEQEFGVLDCTRVHPDDFQIACIIAWMSKHGMGSTKTPPDFLYDDGRMPSAYENCIQQVMKSAEGALKRKKEMSPEWYREWTQTLNVDSFRRGMMHVDLPDHIRESGLWLDDLVRKNVPVIQDLIDGIEGSFVGGKKKAQVLFCIDEMRFPLLDRRLLYSPPSADDYFEMLTGNDRLSMKEGTVITVSMNRVDDRWVQAQVEGLRCSIHQNDLSDERVDFRDERDLRRYVKEKLKWSRGDPIRGVIKSLDRARFLVNLSTKPSDVEAAGARVTDPFWRNPKYLAGAPALDAGKGDSAAAPFRTRPIVHSAFKNVGWEDAEKELSSKGLGELIFRPSSKGFLKLGVSYKCGDNPAWIQHLNVSEKGKKATDPTLSSTLSLDNDTFEDLDELIGRYFTPITEFLRDLYDHRSYRVGSTQQIEQSLRAEKRSEPSRVPYCVGRSEKLPGGFYLFYLPGSNTVQREKVRVTPNGFKIGHSMHTSVDKMIKWFKMNVGQLQAQRMQQARGAAHRGSYANNRGYGAQGYADGGYGDRHAGGYDDRSRGRDYYGRGRYEDERYRRAPRQDTRGGGGYGRY